VVPAASLSVRIFCRLEVGLSLGLSNSFHTFLLHKSLLFKSALVMAKEITVKVACSMHQYSMRLQLHGTVARVEAHLRTHAVFMHAVTSLAENR
jgi:hypothetical protein